MAVRKWAFIALGVLGLGMGTYWGTQYLQCQHLEDEYLNGVSEMKSATASLAIIDHGDTKDALVLVRDLARKRIEDAATGLYQQCGKNAGETAFRKGTEIVLH